MTRSLLLAAAAAMALSSCATWGPTWSEVSGSRAYSRTELNTAPTFVNLVDGQNPGPRIRGYGYGPDYKLEPGSHTMLLQAPPLSRGWAGGTELQTLTLNFEPCKRYYIVAKYANPLGTQWTPQVD